MDSRKSAIQMFRVCMVVGDPFGWFRHAELGITSGHRFHAHQIARLAVQGELAITNLKLADAVCGFRCQTEKVSEELRYAGSEFREDLYEATDDQCSKVASGDRSALRRAVWHGTDHALENRFGEARRFASWKNDT